MSETSPLAPALESPDLPHAVLCDVACARCASKTRCLLRGVAVTADLALLGDLRCGACQHTELDLLPAELAAVLATMRGLLEARRPLPQSTEAFLRGGPFRWLGQSFDDPRALRTALETEAAVHQGDAAAQLRAAAGMVQIRDMRRALELARAAHELAPEAPEPPLFVAEVGYAVGDGAQCVAFAREALTRSDGPLLVLADRARLIEAALRLVQAGEALASASRARPDHGEPDAPCRCGSGRAFRACCGALN